MGLLMRLSIELGLVELWAPVAARPAIWLARLWNRRSFARRQTALLARVVELMARFVSRRVETLWMLQGRRLGKSWLEQLALWTARMRARAEPERTRFAPRGAISR